jgi:hypothetical protein
MPIAVLWQLILGQTLFKWALAVISMPMIYLIPERADADADAADWTFADAGTGMIMSDSSIDRIRGIDADAGADSIDGPGEL